MIVEPKLVTKASPAFLEDWRSRVVLTDQRGSLIRGILVGRTSDGRCWVHDPVGAVVPRRDEDIQIDFQHAAVRDHAARVIASQLEDLRDVKISTAPEWCRFEHCADCGQPLWSLGMSIEEASGAVALYTVGPPRADHDPEPDMILGSLSELDLIDDPGLPDNSSFRNAQALLYFFEAVQSWSCE